MADLPDILSFRCANDDSDRCAGCQRLFSLNSNEVQGVYKDREGRAVFVMSNIKYCPHPECADKMRYIQTDLSYEDAMVLLDGKITTIGDIKMITNDFIS